MKLRLFIHQILITQTTKKILSTHVNDLTKVCSLQIKKVANEKTHTNTHQTQQTNKPENIYK